MFRRPFSILIAIEAALRRPGNGLLSQVLRHSTIGAEAFDGRVRDGIGSYHFARVTRPAKGRKQTGQTTIASAMSPSIDNESDQADRAISTGKLHALLRFHTRPINVVVFHGS